MEECHRKKEVQIVIPKETSKPESEEILHLSLPHTNIEEEYNSKYESEIGCHVIDAPESLPVLAQLLPQTLHVNEPIYANQVVNHV